MQQFPLKLMVGNDILTFNMQKYTRPQIVRYKGDFYTAAAGIGREPLYIKADVVDLANPKVARSRPEEISKDVIEAARDAANQAGLVFKYRNRDGKQYVTILWTSGTINNDWWQAYRNVWSDQRYDRQFIEMFFPQAQHTSGSYGCDSGDHTYRINP